VRELVVGLVVEGKTDYEVLKPFIAQTLANQGYSSSEIVFLEIQPELDATSRQHRDGGWTRVMQWCLAHPPEDRDQLYFEEIFDDQHHCDVIVVQMDGDVIGEYAAHVHNTSLPTAPWDVAKRGGFVEAALNEWLWPSGSISSYKDSHILAVSVQAIETWLLAGYDHSIPNLEEIDPTSLLISHKSDIRKVENGRVKLTKSAEKWGQMTDEIIGNLSHIRRVCSYCDKFLTQVERYGFQ